MPGSATGRNIITGVRLRFPVPGCLVRKPHAEPRLSRQPERRGTTLRLATLKVIQVHNDRGRTGKPEAHIAT